MGFVNSMFNRHETVSLVFEGKSNTFVNGVIGPETWSTLATLTGFFWVGSSADQVVGERIRANIDGVVVIDKEDLTVALPDTTRVTIDGADVFNIVYADNIAFQDKVVILPVKRVTDA